MSDRPVDDQRGTHTMMREMPGRHEGCESKELMRLTRIELTDLLVRTTDALPDMPERSENRQIALINVRNIRAVLARHDLTP